MINIIQNEVDYNSDYFDEFMFYIYKVLDIKEEKKKMEITAIFQILLSSSYEEITHSLNIYKNFLEQYDLDIEEFHHVQKEILLLFGFKSREDLVVS